MYTPGHISFLKKWIEIHELNIKSQEKDILIRYEQVKKFDDAGYKATSKAIVDIANFRKEIYKSKKAILSLKRELEKLS